MKFIIDLEPADGRLFFRQAWIEGADEENDIAFDFTCGAGLGSPTVHLSVTHKGETRRFAGIITDSVVAAVNEVVAEMDA